MRTPKSISNERRDPVTLMLDMATCKDSPYPSRLDKEATRIRSYLFSSRNPCRHPIFMDSPEACVVRRAGAGRSSPRRSPDLTYKRAARVQLAAATVPATEKARRARERRRQPRQSMRTTGTVSLICEYTRTECTQYFACRTNSRYMSRAPGEIREQTGQTRGYRRRAGRNVILCVNTASSRLHIVRDLHRRRDTVAGGLSIVRRTAVEVGRGAAGSAALAFVRGSATDAPRQCSGVLGERCAVRSSLLVTRRPVLHGRY
ncbi:hypothetical protein EVAR_37733_1 [Eumeta japonica]|uniref:Uncharacterized protein n=1 Tax=Eumeta variegata TaxID=151549 RepID=A0A4C1YPS3_EUMVA|nr:hypothetical protein EVAR_37733_1 [Eumeta japonica]